MTMQTSLESSLAETPLNYKVNEESMNHLPATVGAFVPYLDTSYGQDQEGEGLPMNYSDLRHQNCDVVDPFPSLNSGMTGLPPFDYLEFEELLTYNDSKTIDAGPFQAGPQLSCLYSPPNFGTTDGSSHIPGMSMVELMDWLQVASSTTSTYSYETRESNMMSPNNVSGINGDYTKSQDIVSPGETNCSLLSPTSFVSTIPSDSTFADETRSPKPQCHNHSSFTPPYTITTDIVLRGVHRHTNIDFPYPQYTLIPSSSPPATDFLSTQAEMVPRQQRDKSRGESDLYTPIWFRGENLSREGWCNYCKPGCWLNLKTSQYLYHLQHAHGICQVNGQVCAPPSQLRVYQNGSQIIDGLCGNCHQWITIGTARRRRNFSSWFDHARKCHKKQNIRRAVRQPAVESSTPSSSSLLPITPPKSRLGKARINPHHRSQSCGAQSMPTLQNSTVHKRGAESISLPTDKKLRLQ